VGPPGPFLFHAYFSLRHVDVSALDLAMGTINTPGNIIRRGVNAVGSMVGQTVGGIGNSIDSEPD
jgi:hypothetical protein